MSAPRTLLLAAILAVVDLAYTRRRVRAHTDPVNAPGTMRQARAHVLSTLAEAAAADVVPMSREEISKWATWLEASLEDVADDFALARELLDGLPERAARPIRALLLAAPHCVGACACSCGHPCAEHNLGGGTCSAAGCRCTSLSHQGSPNIMGAILEAEKALQSAAAPVGGA